MKFFRHHNATDAAELEAINKSRALIHFNLDGIVLDANDNFLNAMGYTLDEIRGKHHSIFVDPAYAKSNEYSNFWRKLSQGEHQTAHFKRIGKGGKELWIEASYCPVLDEHGKPVKIVKYASDITDQKRTNAEYAGQIEAIGKSQAVIHFDLNGNILKANDNFLSAMGYRLDEIKGRNHSMFVEPEYAKSHEYRAFWDHLRRGEFEAGQFKRIGKGGKEVWIEASYNPIMDEDGKPFKVVKYATDITKQKLIDADYSGQIAAIGKSQAVIHFNLDGTIIDANDNFLNAMGYTLDEVKGKHHRMFVAPEYAKSAEYRKFWEQLGRGQYQADEYNRIAKGGKEIWLQASYNPILDMSGKPFKVVKYATVITAQMDARIRAGQLVEQANGNVSSIASSVEEMTASISEISKNMSLSQQAVNDIVAKASMADDATTQLAQTSRSMEGVIELIRGIAAQVNMLALNATIEAARAGDSGKGFAVVAAEVKNLASQTTKATDDIAREIAAMQNVSRNVSESVSEIGRTTSSVSQYVNGVAGAIEEQTAVTREISASMQKTSQGVEDIHECVKQISGARA